MNYFKSPGWPRLGAMLACLLTVGHSANAQIISNGDFEAPVVNPPAFYAANSNVPIPVPVAWTWDGPSRGALFNDGAALSGAQHLRLGEDDYFSIFQNFTIAASGEYRLEWYDKSNGVFPSVYTVSILNSANATIISRDFDATTVAVGTWAARSFSVAVAPGAYTLRFKKQYRPAGSATTFLDNVTMVPTLVAPVFSTQPQGGTVFVAATSTLFALATGAPAPALQWQKNGVGIPGATTNTLLLNSVSLADAGTYALVATNSLGSATSNGAVITVVVPTAPASITSQPTNQSPASGGRAAFTVSVAGNPAPSVQWQRSVDGGNSWSDLRNDATVSGATSAALNINGATTAMWGHQFRAVVSDSAGTVVTSSAATLYIATGRLVNVSVRGSAGAAAQTLIVGIGTAGVGEKSILIRGVGPGLSPFGVNGVLADPQIALFGPTGFPVGQNNDWGGGATLSRAFLDVGAFGLTPTSRDAALIATMSPGTNTAQLSGVAGSTGVVLAEVYDLDLGLPSTRIVNVAVRNQVGVGENVLTIGFVVSGNAPQRLLVRGIGPGLAQFSVQGTLENPRLQVFSNSTLIQENDDWAGAAQLTSAFTAVGAFALQPTSRDAALLLTLQPGSYSAQVSGVAGGTGIALVEIYEVP